MHLWYTGAGAAAGRTVPPVPHTVTGQQKPDQQWLCVFTQLTLPFLLSGSALIYS